MIKKEQQPIGVFDSGLGGLSVLKQLIALMPTEDYIYYGDSLHAPYGTKSLDEVRDLTLAAAEILLQHHIKGLVIACNTATSAAIRDLRSKYPELPVVGIEPAIKPAALQHPAARVLVMATPRTLKEEKFLRLSRRYKDQTEIVRVPCEGLMEFVEQGILEGEELERYLRDRLSPYVDEKTEAVVLGCTHYPFIWNTLERVLGKQITIYDGSLGTARELRRRLQEAGLLRLSQEEGHVVLMNSKETQVLKLLSEPDGKELIPCESPAGLMKLAVQLLQSSQMDQGYREKEQII